MIKKFLNWIIRLFDSRNTPCSICGDVDCKRKHEGPWHGTPHEPGNPPTGGITVKRP